jgi:hypothetical protein
MTGAKYASGTRSLDVGRAGLGNVAAPAAPAVPLAGLGVVGKAAELVRDPFELAPAGSAAREPTDLGAEFGRLAERLDQAALEKSGSCKSRTRSRFWRRSPCRSAHAFAFEHRHVQLAGTATRTSSRALSSGA